MPLHFHLWICFGSMHHVRNKKHNFEFNELTVPLTRLLLKFIFCFSLEIFSSLIHCNMISLRCEIFALGFAEMWSYRIYNMKIMKWITFCVYQFLATEQRINRQNPYIYRMYPRHVNAICFAEKNRKTFSFTVNTITTIWGSSNMALISFQTK